MSADKATLDKVIAMIAGREKDPDKLLVMLEDIQHEAGYLPEEAMSAVAEHLGISKSAVFGVASFYSFLSTRPLGRNVIRICRSLPCDMAGYEAVAGSIEKELGIKPGETTPDGRYSFEITNCIGACDRAPAMMVNDDIHGDLTPERVIEVLREYE